MSDARNILELYVENIRTPQMNVYNDGSKRWTVNGMYHRQDGPAIEQTDGKKMWLQLGMMHRLDGAAVEESDGKKEWWVSGNEYKNIEQWAKAALKYESKHNEEPSQQDVDDKIAAAMQQDLFD